MVRLIVEQVYMPYAICRTSTSTGTVSLEPYCTYSTSTSTVSPAHAATRGGQAPPLDPPPKP